MADKVTSNLIKRLAIAVIAYSIVFLFVGQAVNQYWGALLAPAFALGAGQFPAAWRRLWQAAWRRPEHAQ